METAPAIVRVPWREHVEIFADEWEATKTPHVSIICPSGGGKSYLLTHGILPIVSDERVMLFDVKGDDPSLNMPSGPNFKRIRKMPHRLLRRDTTDRKCWYRFIADDRESMKELMAIIHAEGDWIEVYDEVRAITDKLPALQLAAEVDTEWLRGRSRAVTVIACTQAPRWVPASFYEQASHLYIGRMTDKRALLRLEEIGGDTDGMREVLRSLKRYEWLYIGPIGESGDRITHITKVA